MRSARQRSSRRTATSWSGARLAAGPPARSVSPLSPDAGRPCRSEGKFSEAEEKYRRVKASAAGPRCRPAARGAGGARRALHQRLLVRLAAGDSGVGPLRRRQGAAQDVPAEPVAVPAQARPPGRLRGGVQRCAAVRQAQPESLFPTRAGAPGAGAAAGGGGGPAPRRGHLSRRRDGGDEPERGAAPQALALSAGSSNQLRCAACAKRQSALPRPGEPARAATGACRDGGERDHRR